MKKSYFQSIISLHALKLALNKSMRASDDEQGISKLWPNRQYFRISSLKYFFFILYFVFFILEILRVSLISNSFCSLEIPYPWELYVFVLFSVCLKFSLWWMGATNNYHCN